jgi:hypothetical protein
MTSTELTVLQTATDTLGFDAATGRLVSFRSQHAPEQEFLAFAPEHPAFVLNYIDAHRESRAINSSATENVQVEVQESEGLTTLTATYRRLAGLDLDVRFSVRASQTDPFSRWSISVSNQAGLNLTSVQFPFIVCAYDLGGTPGSESLVLPHGYGTGQLLQHLEHGSGLGVYTFPGDTWTLWDVTTISNHYPGMQYVQLLAYYNDRAGLYLACQDPVGHLKMFRPVHREPGVRLGVSHVGDWANPGERTLEYDVVLSSFAGDWYAAAEIYRQWALQQAWAVPLGQREDVPAWLKDSPVYLTLRPQGELDAGPVDLKREFLPYEKCIPLLESVAEKVQAPLATVLMGWERPGSWIGPDSLPPVGGEESLRRFVALARERGWHVGTFANGTRWIVSQAWSGYDGFDYFYAHGGPESVCRDRYGSPGQIDWIWRLHYDACLGSQVTHEFISVLVSRMIGWGFESLQFFDQNNGAATCPCYSADHDHPPVPGQWMTARMHDMLTELRGVAEAAGEPGVIHSTESGVCEVNLPLFQETEFRFIPPGCDWDPVHVTSIPLYTYLFHECIILQGMMSLGPEPHHLETANAANCVWGALPGGVLTGDGTLLNRDTPNWAPWEPKIGNPEDGFEMIRTVAALRRGPARDFLVFGRMLKPAPLQGVETIEWTYQGRPHRVPAVFDATWQASDGRIGVVLANWTDAPQTVEVADDRLPGTSRTVYLSAAELITQTSSGAAATVVLPPRSCALVE